MKRVTLDDLSAHLGLSKFSVSRALSGKGGVSDRTRQQVFDAARELGYDHPAIDVPGAPIGRRLVLIIPRIDAVTSPFWMEIVAGAEEEARRSGYDLAEYLIRDGGDTRPLPSGVRGMILAGRRSRGLHEPYLQMGLPVTLIGHPLPTESIDSVRPSNSAGGYLVGRHLVECGHRHIAFVTEVPGDKSRAETLRGLQDAVKDVPGAMASSVFYDPATDALETLRAVFSAPHPPTALLGASDNVAMTMAWALTEAGLKVPQHVSVVGSNDSEVATQLGLKLTSVRNPMRQVGAAAIQMMDWRLDQASPGEPVRRLQLEPTFIVRDSTAPANPDGLRKALAATGFAQLVTQS